MTDVVNDVIINYESKNLDQTVGGIKQTSVALDGLVIASSSTEKATASLQNKFASLERQFGTTGGNAAQFAKVQKTVNDAVGQNPALLAAGNEVIAAAEKKYLSAGNAVAGLGHASEGLSTQSQALFHAFRGGIEQIAVGIPFTQALTSEMNHLTYAATGPGGISGAFAGLGGFIKNLVSPTTLWIGGIVAATAAAAALANQWDKVQVSSQRALIGAGARTGTSVSDINSFVSQNSGISGSGLSNKEARTLGEDLTKTGDIVVSQLHGMSDAVVGFSNQTGKSITEATKEFVAFGKDPIAGMKEFAGVFGDFDIGVRKAVEEFVRADEKTNAYNVVLDALSEKSKEAAQNMGGLEKATRTVVNALATESGKPVGLEQQLEAQRQRIVAASNSPAGAFGGGEEEKSQTVERQAKAYDDLNAALQRVDATRAKAQVDKLSTDADNADKAIISQLNAIDQLKTKIEELNRAKAAGTTSQYGAGVDNAALQAAQNQLAALTQSQAEAARYNQQVAAISQNWGNVGQSVALQLQTMQNSLPVAEAWTNATKMRAQYEATYLDLIQNGKTAEEASAVAAKQYELSKAAAVASAEKLVQSSQDNLDKIRAQGTGMEGVVASSIAYRDAIQSGATAMQANIIAANTLRASILQAAQAQNQLDQSTASYNAAQVAAHKGSGTGDFVPITMNSGASSFSSDPNINVHYLSGGAGKRIDVGADVIAIQKFMATQNDPNNIANSYVAQGNYAGAISALERQTGGSVTDRTSIIDSLTQVLNGQTTDKGAQTANLKNEQAWLQTQPETIARDQKIIDLQNSIDQLTASNNANTSATSANTDALSPYYTQDPRTSHIGFRSQGMATGGDLTVPGGYSANDNMIAQIPVASGEIVSVRRPGQNVSGGSTQTISVVNHITIAGNANKDEVLRTSYQIGQTMARQLASAGR